MGAPTEGFADLHRHLDGSLRSGTLAELAGALRLDVPVELAFRPGIGLQEALARFAFTLSVLQSPAAVKRVASEMCEDAAAEGVTTLEIRFAPQLHGDAGVEAIIDAAIEGISGRAGLVLCGLYGESPEVLESLVDAATSRPGVVGIDLAGGPAPDHTWALADYADVFQRAAQVGLGRTVHAGEGRPPEEIRTAIERLGAQRIGHGTTLMDDPDVLQLVVEAGVTIEACPTSNVHTGLIPFFQAHPLRAWLDAGVKVTLCTDNTLLSATTMNNELRGARMIPGLNADHLAALTQYGHEAAFSRS